MKYTYLLAACVAAISFNSCKKKKNPEPLPTNSTESGYFIGLKTESGGNAAEYVLTTANLMSGTISATGIGTEQMGWMYYHKTTSNKYLAIDYTNKVCTGYTLNGSKIAEAGSFIFDRIDVIQNTSDGNIIGVGAPWGGGSYDCKIQTINPTAMAITKTVSHPLYTLHDDTLARLNMWPTHTFIDGSKFYVSFYPLHGSSWDTKRTDTAYVSVFSYPEMVYQTTFKDARTSPIGYYGGSPCILTDESGNHYTLSTSSLAAGFTQSTKPSGILKINSGATEFDASYFFNIESQGYRLLTGTYVTNGKAVVRVVSIANDATVWGAFTVDNPICKIAVIDLHSQSFKIVDEIPLHGGQYFTPFLVEDGKVYVSVNDGTKANVYRVDPTAGTAQQGAAIDGNQLQGIYKY